MKTQSLYLIFVFIFLNAPFGAMATEKPIKPFIVVLDAGHGGKDPGNLGNGYMEKIIALKIALRTGEILSKNQDIKIVYTRDSDRFVDLFKRGEIANKAAADLFISIHCDSHTSNAHGAGTFVLGLHANNRNFEVAKKENSAIYLEENFEQRYAQYDINSPESVIGFTIMQEEFLDQSISLAKSMQDRFANNLKRNDRKVKQAGFIVLHQTFMPSVLVETGFLTNANEGAFLNSKEGQNQMAEAIAEAVIAYKKEVHSSSVVANPTEGINKTINKTSEAVPVAKEAVAEKAVAEKAAAKEAVAEKALMETAVLEKALLETAVLEKSPNKGTRLPLQVAEMKKEEMKSANEIPKSKLLFKIQLMAVSKDLALTAENFKGLKAISKEQIGSLTRYLYGATADYNQAKDLLVEAIKAGYTNAFVAAYKNGEKITLTEALKSLD